MPGRPVAVVAAWPTQGRDSVLWAGGETLELVGDGDRKWVGWGGGGI